MQDEHLRNPAGRLFRLLEGMQQRTGNQAPILHALADYLGHPRAEQTRALLLALAEIWPMPDNVHEAADALFNPSVPIREFIPDLQRARAAAVYLLRGLNTPGTVFQSHIDGSVLQSLKVLSHLIKQRLADGSPD